VTKTGFFFLWIFVCGVDMYDQPIREMPFHAGVYLTAIILDFFS
jgi:hypothetical protein